MKLLFAFYKKKIKNVNSKTNPTASQYIQYKHGQNRVILI